MPEDPIIRRMSPEDWHKMIQLLKTQKGYCFDPILDHYLALTIEAYLTDCKIFDKILAVEYLQALQLSGQQEFDALRKTGDHCLLLTGFFPEYVQNHNLSLDYYTSIGKNAYASVAAKSFPIKIDNKLFYGLSEHFIGLSDILFNIRTKNSDYRINPNGN